MGIMETSTASLVGDMRFGFDQSPMQRWVSQVVSGKLNGDPSRGSESLLTCLSGDSRSHVYFVAATMARLDEGLNVLVTRALAMLFEL